MLSSWGLRLGLVKSEGELSAGGIIATVTVFLLVVGVTAFQKIKDSKELKQRKDIKQQLKDLRVEKEIQIAVSRNLNSSYDGKILGKLRQIEEYKSLKDNAFNVYRESYQQLVETSECLETSLNELLFTFAKANGDRDLYVSIAYRFPNVAGASHEKWFWAPSKREEGLPIDGVLLKNSTFMRLLELKEPYLIFNSKKEAVQRESYIPDDKDTKDDLKGSIACYRIYKRAEGQVQIEAIIGVSTYRAPFLEEEEAYKLDRLAVLIQEMVINAASRQIFNELCNFYIQKLLDKDRSKKLSKK
jgi:hypothetical protein